MNNVYQDVVFHFKDRLDVTGATGWLAVVRVSWCGRGWVEGYAMASTQTEIIDRLKPSGDWKIVVRGVSSVCKSQGLLRPRRCQRNLK